MVEVKEIIATIEAMEKSIKEKDTEIADLRIKLWNNDQEINNLKTELEQWRKGPTN